jgi:hypothetical protein
MKPRVMKVGGRWYASDGQKTIGCRSLIEAYDHARAMQGKRLRHLEVRRRLREAEMRQAMDRALDSLPSGGSGA